MQAAITPADIRWPISIGYSDLPETETFTVEAIDRLSLYETVMVYCGRPPWNPELRKRDATHEMVSEWLTTFNEDATTAVLRDLLGLINRGELPAATIFDDGGKIDFLKSTVVAADALLALVRVRGETAWFVAEVDKRTDPANQKRPERPLPSGGGRGRPSFLKFYVAEHERRVGSGSAFSAPTDEAKFLRQQIEQEWPDEKDRWPSVKSIMDGLRREKAKNRREN